MIQLTAMLYISSASPSLSDEDLYDILKVSRINNERANITGVLCSGGGYFIQIMEGPQKEMLQGYLRILDDPRHHDCLLIGLVPIKERKFKDWSMGHINASSENMKKRRQELISYWNNKEKGEELVSLMSRLVRQLREN